MILLNTRPGFYVFFLRQGFTFLTGAAGVHAVGAAVAQRTGDHARARHHAREVAAMEEKGKQILKGGVCTTVA